MNFVSLLRRLFSTEPFPAMEIKEVRAEISFQDAIRAHRAWKSMLCASVTERPSAPISLDVLRRDDCCELGKWLHGAGGQRYGDLQSFDELVAKHAYFHTVAGQVAKLTQDGEKEEARELLVGEFELASIAIVARLEKFASVFQEEK